jgi:hypothetical protein
MASIHQVNATSRDARISAAHGVGINSAIRPHRFDAAAGSGEIARESLSAEHCSPRERRALLAESRLPLPVVSRAILISIRSGPAVSLMTCGVYRSGHAR